VYLNELGDEYIINISPYILGSALNTSTSPPTWSLINILAGPVPTSGTVPSDIFTLFQTPAKLIVQNVSGVPIMVSLDNTPTNLTFFVFGEKTDNSVHSYVIPGLSFLIIDAIFTNNLFIRFTNIYLDGNLDYVEVIDTMSNAIAANYNPALSMGLTPLEETLLGYIIEDSGVEAMTNYVSKDLNGLLNINVANQETINGLVSLRVDTTGFNLYLDGSGISTTPGSSNGVMIMMIDVSASGSGTLTLNNLNNSSSGVYNANPLTLYPEKAYFIAVVGSNVYITDPSGFFGALLNGASYVAGNAFKAGKFLYTTYNNLPPETKSAVNNIVSKGVSLAGKTVGSIVSKFAPKLGGFLSSLF
jgi:hypothetical protein